ncbi:MAG: ABC transporter substrate-binding protein [Dehalococcoidia bacterium]|nr:ABC transporter substrate-binding protein [Dehalococcoidia bacterium]
MQDTMWSRTVRGKVGRRSLLRGAGLAGAGLAGAALLGCGSDDDTPTATSTATAGGTQGPATGATATPGGGEVKRGGLYRHSITNDPPTIDPYRNASANTKTVSAHSYSRLYRINPQPGVQPYDAEIIPDVAESAESEDGQHWVVKLKQGVKFHNVAPVRGRELNAADVAFSFQRLTAEGSPNGAAVSYITGVEALDDYTLEFTLDGPSPSFLETLSDANLLFIQPVEADGDFDPALQAIGSGPWVLDEYLVSQSLKYSRHPEYHDADVPYLDNVETFIIPEYANRMAQFQAGSLQSMTVTSDDVPLLRRDEPDVQWVPIPGGTLNFVGFSGEDRDPTAPWRDERFRRAVSMAIDRAGQMEFGFNLQAITDAGLHYPVMWNNCPVPASFGPQWWVDPQSEEQGESAAYFEFNPEEASALLQAMGLGNDPINFHYAGNNHYGPGFDRLAQVVFAWLGDVGVRLENAPQDYNSTYITQTFRGDFNGMMLGVETPFPEINGYFNRMFGDDISNHGRVHDSIMDDLIAKQRHEMDEPTRREFVAEMQRRNGDQMFYVPVQPSGGAVWEAFQPEVRGVRRTRGYGAAAENVPYYWLDV